MARKKTTRRTSRRWNPVTHPGSLKKVGYTPESKSSISRHRALNKAVQEYGYTETIRKLAFLKGAARVPPNIKRTASSDLNWLEKKYKTKKRG